MSPAGVSTPVRVLLVEDNPGDARLIVEMLREVDGTFEIESVERMGEAVERLGREGVDVVLLDLGLPDCDGMETFARAVRAATREPIVVISGLDDEKVALEAVRAGAQDYLVKGQADGRLLARVIRHAIERKGAEDALREREERFRQVTETMREVFFLVDAGFTETLYVSPGYAQIFGRSRESLYDAPQSFMEAILREDRPKVSEGIGRNLQGDPDQMEFRIQRPDSEIRWVLVNSRGIRDNDGKVYRIAGVALDVTERKEIEGALRASEQRLRTLFETVNLIVLSLDADGRVEYANPFLSELTEHGESTLVGMSWIERFVPERHHEEMAAAFEGLLAEGLNIHNRSPILTKDGEERMISWHNTVLRDADGQPIGSLSIGEDITEKVLLEDHLQRAQRMEAVGRLAGGIAHDFNNLLTAILGPAELLLLDTEAGSSAHEDLTEITSAAERAAGLTRQLLAFSRQQVLEPRVVDLNTLVADLERLLRRVIGEDIDLRIAPGADRGTVRADPGQLEQVLLNLAINSRDAMPTGGTLAIETANVDLDGTYLESHVPVVPGHYVMVAVSDTGIGMDRETKAKIFEPFFTTKPTGKGTGLGLATVYGIVKQSGGYIWVYSEVEQGTIFKIYLPREDAEAEALALDDETLPSLTGTETILVVEDEGIVQAATRKMLEAYGCDVLTASGGHEALEIARTFSGPIPLLVSDVVMPEMGGRELNERLLEIRPDIKVVFVSGYTNDMITHHGVLDPSVQFLQKPFSSSALARRVRQVLDLERA